MKFLKLATFSGKKYVLFKSFGGKREEKLNLIIESLIKRSWPSHDSAIPGLEGRPPSKMHFKEWEWFISLR
jgi:hypothetical protein